MRVFYAVLFSLLSLEVHAWGHAFREKEHLRPHVFGAKSSHRRLTESNGPTEEEKRIMDASAATMTLEVDPGIAGEYHDPKHPNGYRTVSLEKSKATITGHDEQPLPAAPEWTLTGTVSGKNLQIDFGPKGGSEVEAIFDGSGLVFPTDGNRWSKRQLETTVSASQITQDTISKESHEAAVKEIKQRAEKELSVLRSKTEQAEKSLANAQESIAKAGQLSKQFEEMYNDEKKKVNELEETVSSLRNTVVAKDKETEKYREDMSSQQGNMQARLSDVENQLKEARASIKSLKDKSNQDASQLSSLQFRLQDSKSETETIQGEYKKIKGENNELQEKLDTLQFRYDNLFMDYEIAREEADNPDLLAALSRKGSEGVTQLYTTNPAIAAAINKTFDAVYPTLASQRAAGATILTETHATIKESMKPYVGDEYIPMVSGLLVYGLVFIPLFLSFWCLASVQAVLKLRPVLIFLHLYFCLASLVAAGSALLIESDPLSVFQSQDPGTYLFFQGLMFLLFVVYLGFMAVAFCRSRNLFEWITRTLQLAVVLTLASFYFHLVWEPAMLDRPPSILTPEHVFLPYAGTAFVSVLILVSEQLIRRRVAEDPSVRGADKDDDTVQITVNVSSEMNETPSAFEGPKAE